MKMVSVFLALALASLLPSAALPALNAGVPEAFGAHAFSMIMPTCAARLDLSRLLMARRVSGQDQGSVVVFTAEGYTATIPKTSDEIAGRAQVWFLRYQDDTHIIPMWASMPSPFAPCRLLKMDPEIWALFFLQTPSPWPDAE